MATRIGPVLSLALMGASFLSAQQGRVAGPRIGFVYDTAGHVLRPVRGIPGASVIGDAVDLGIDVANVHVAPLQDSAFAIASDGSIHFLRLTDDSTAEHAIDGLSVAPERVAFSPTGSAAALYTAGHVQVIRGLPDSPTLSTQLDLSAGSTLLAVSDDGAYLLSAGNGTLQLIATAGGPRKLMDAADGILAAFAPNANDAAVADSAAGLVLFRDLAGASQMSSLASGDNAVASPVGLAFSSDGGKLHVSSSTARSVTTFDLKSGSRADVACSCAPAGLVRMGNVYRLNDLGADPLWLLDSLAPEPRTVFVPALVPPSAN